jgi:hypothetical protein
MTKLTAAMMTVISAPSTPNHRHEAQLEVYDHLHETVEGKTKNKNLKGRSREEQKEKQLEGVRCSQTLGFDTML